MLFHKGGLENMERKENPIRCKKCGGLLHFEKIYDGQSESIMIERCANCSFQTDTLTEINRNLKTPPAPPKTKRYPKYKRKITKAWWI